LLGVLLKVFARPLVRLVEYCARGISLKPPKRIRNFDQNANTDTSAVNSLRFIDLSAKQVQRAISIALRQHTLFLIRSRGILVLRSLDLARLLAAMNRGHEDRPRQQK